MLPSLTQRKKAVIILIVLVGAMMATERKAEKYGDMLQITLPILAGACQLANGQFGDFMTRFVALEIMIHGPKNTLGDMEINRRPSGNDGGFPSGHTAAASFGATSLIFNCVQNHFWVKTGLVLAAAFTGATRLEAEKHFVWQVFAGWLLGFYTDRIWRHGKGPYPFVMRMGATAKMRLKQLYNGNRLKQLLALRSKSKDIEPIVKIINSPAK